MTRVPQLECGNTPGRQLLTHSSTANSRVSAYCLQSHVFGKFDSQSTHAIPAENGHLRTDNPQPAPKSQNPQ
jgi:hypothetical protein